MSPQQVSLRASPRGGATGKQQQPYRLTAYVQDRLQVSLDKKTVCIG